MALSRSIFHPKFAYHARPIVHSGMKAKVTISRVMTEGTYNVVTGLIEGGVVKPLYRGPAFIDKAARPTRRDFVFDAADNQVMEVQIPFELHMNELAPTEAPDYQSGDVVTVVANPDNPSLVGETFYVHGDAGSSEAWVQTLVCRYSAKQGS